MKHFTAIMALLLLPPAGVFMTSLSLGPESRPAALPPLRYEEVAHLISRADWEAGQPIHRRMLQNLVEEPLARRQITAPCWTAMMPYAFMQAFNAAIQGPPGTDFETGNRWTTTASGSSFGQGSPITLTYSIVPDGTFIPSGVGEPAGSSDLVAVFNSIFPSQATWQNLLQQAFQRWGQLTGITYVFEPNDDGASFFGSQGVLGVRGDIRISGKFIDGQSGANTLAFNNFPSGGGDMVLDTSNTSFFGNANSNFRRFRNVVTHEHGHGIGLFHVCPDNNTKLMEPVITTAFDGPQIDDRLGGQRLYGDTNETNDATSTATNLGTLANGPHSVANVSLDDNSDVDFYKFTVLGNKQLTLTLNPVGSPYLTGPQTSSCTTGNTFNPSAINDLGFEVRDTNGTTILASVNQNPVGQSEGISGLALISGAGTYFIRVFGGTANNIQPYSMLLTIADTVLPPFTISVSGGVPTTVLPNQPHTLDVQVTNVTGAPNPATAQLFVSTDGSPFISSPLADLGGGSFQGTLPAAPCFTRFNWYVSMAPVGGGAPVVQPEGAPTFATNLSEALITPLQSVFTDNFNTNLGWSVTNGPALTAGAWERGIPIGGGTRGDPPTAAGGSGQAFVTENQPGNSDVDGDFTRLTSPIFDLSGRTDARVEVDLWFDNDFGSNPGTEPLFVDVSDNGGATWTNMEVYNQSPNVWVTRQYRLSDFGVNFTSQMRVRFTTQDPPPGSVVEAGVDNFKVLVCVPLPSLDPACAAGTVGITTGTVQDVFTINLQTGGAARRVDIPLGGSMVFRMVTPNLSPGPAPFIIFGRVGLPGPAEATPLPFFIGTLCFSPTVLDPTNLNLFVLADNLTGGPAFLTSNPTTWIKVVPGLSVPLTLTLQPLILEDGIQLRTGNAIILNIQ